MGSAGHSTLQFEFGRVADLETTRLGFAREKVREPLLERREMPGSEVESDGVDVPVAFDRPNDVVALDVDRGAVVDDPVLAVRLPEEVVGEFEGFRSRVRSDRKRRLND